MVHRNLRCVNRDWTGDSNKAIQSHICQVARLAQSQTTDRACKGVVARHQSAKAVSGWFNRDGTRACESRSRGSCVVGEHHAACTARACGACVAVHTREAECVAAQLVELACSRDHVGHRHCCVVVEVESGVCGDADSVGAQRSQSIRTITHVQSTARNGGETCVGVRALHHPLACASFGEAAAAGVVGQHGSHGVVCGVGTGQREQSTRCAAVGQSTGVGEHQSTCA